MIQCVFHVMVMYECESLHSLYYAHRKPVIAQTQNILIAEMQFIAFLVIRTAAEEMCHTILI